MRFCVYTAHTAQYAPLAELTERGKLDYARLHGYDFHSARLVSEDIYGPGFERLERMLPLMNSGSYEWIFWSGADVLLTNHDIPLESLTHATHDLIICNDASGLQSDVFLIRYSSNMVKLISAIIGMRQWFINSPNREQDAMAVLIQTLYRDHVEFIPQRRLNSFDYTLYHHLGEHYAAAKDTLGNDGQWQPGDFAIHFPALPLERRDELVKEYIAKI